MLKQLLITNAASSLPLQQYHMMLVIYELTVVKLNMLLMQKLVLVHMRQLIERKLQPMILRQTLLRILRMLILKVVLCYDIQKKITQLLTNLVLMLHQHQLMVEHEELWCLRIIHLILIIFIATNIRKAMELIHDLMLCMTELQQKLKVRLGQLRQVYLVILQVIIVP
jgi:hypothetical protein